MGGSGSISSPNPEAHGESQRLRKAIAEARTVLHDARKHLQGTIQDEPIMAEIPVEADAAISLAVDAIDRAIRRLESTGSVRAESASPPDGPTRQQGQFLAFIGEYMIRNEAGAAPSHADLQRFFNLTAPSVNLMLIRLEKRKFIRRIPGKARAIELIIDADWIPALDRPFKF
jgi:DNA-binding MarR family transcriptional regulator